MHIPKILTPSIASSPKTENFDILLNKLENR